MMLQGWLVVIMLFIMPKRLLSIPKCHPYTGNLTSEKPGDSKNAFLHCGDVYHCHVDIARLM